MAPEFSLKLFDGKIIENIVLWDFLTLHINTKNFMNFQLHSCKFL